MTCRALAKGDASGARRRVGARLVVVVASGVVV